MPSNLDQTASSCSKWYKQKTHRKHFCVLWQAFSLGTQLLQTLMWAILLVFSRQDSWMLKIDWNNLDRNLLALFPSTFPIVNPSLSITYELDIYQWTSQHWMKQLTSSIMITKSSVQRAQINGINPIRENGNQNWLIEWQQHHLLFNNMWACRGQHFQFPLTVLARNFVRGQCRSVKQYGVDYEEILFHICMNMALMP